MTLSTEWLREIECCAYDSDAEIALGEAADEIDNLRGRIDVLSKHGILVDDIEVYIEQAGGE